MRQRSPYRKEITELEDRLDNLRRLDREWIEDRDKRIQKTKGSCRQLARKFGLSRQRIQEIRPGALR